MEEEMLVGKWFVSICHYTCHFLNLIGVLFVIMVFLIWVCHQLSMNLCSLEPFFLLTLTLIFILTFSQWTK